MREYSDKPTISVKPDKVRLLNLLDEIYHGAIKIPIFQRDFVWKQPQMIDLFDSIFKGYPIGSLLMWKPEEKFLTKRFIGPFGIDSEGRDISYVLDGFQRISTLFGVLMSADRFPIVDNNKEKDFLINYNLKDKEFVYQRKRGRLNNPHLMPLSVAVDTFLFLDFLRVIEQEVDDRSERAMLIDNAKELNKILYDYEIPYVQIRGGDIESAVQIFSRTNSTGTDISKDFMLQALSYNSNRDFLFSDHITEFLNTLNVYNFDNLKRDTILNCIASSRGKIFFDVKVEELLKPDLETLATNAFEHISKAVEFLYRDMLVLDVRLLPYPTQLIFISEFFRLNPQPDVKMLNKLKSWFWFTSYSNYFTIYTLSQQRIAHRVFLEFARGEHEDGIYRMKSGDDFSVGKFPEKMGFTSVRSKILQLFMLNRFDGMLDDTDGNQVIETPVFNKIDRIPANTLVWPSSLSIFPLERRDVNVFINNSNETILEQFFIDADLLKLYNGNRIKEFLEDREFLISNAELRFIRSLNISNDTDFDI